MDKAEKILLVDDEGMLRTLLGEVLSREGFQVTTASDGQESLERMDGTDFDLVVTDVNMPRLDGIELLRRMKAAGRTEKVIVMTGDPHEERYAGTDMPPVITRLLKPFPMDNFLQTVAAAVSRTRAAAAGGRPQAL